MAELLAVLKAAGGLFLIFGIWVGMQALQRRSSGCRREHDVLGHMAHACGSCRNESCSRGQKGNHATV